MGLEIREWYIVARNCLALLWRFHLRPAWLGHPGFLALVFEDPNGGRGLVPIWSESQYDAALACLPPGSRVAHLTVTAAEFRELHQRDESLLRHPRPPRRDAAAR